jgi:hypothetical protein
VGSEDRRARQRRSEPEQSPGPQKRARIVQGRARSGRAANAMQQGRELFVGIDVSKRQLDVALGDDGELWQEANGPAAHAALSAKLGNLRPALIVVEATGGYES